MEADKKPVYKCTLSDRCGYSSPHRFLCCHSCSHFPACTMKCLNGPERCNVVMICTEPLRKDRKRKA